MRRTTPLTLRAVGIAVAATLMLPLGGGLANASTMAVTEGPRHVRSASAAGIRAAVTAPDFAGARAAIERLVGAAADQIDLVRITSEGGNDRYSVAAVDGRLQISATSAATAVAGLQAYLGSIGRSVSWNVGNVALDGALELPATPIEATANVSHRFYGNDTEDGYTGAYRTWEEWERAIDELAALGFNEVFMPVGSETVYSEVFQHFGYSAEEMREWIPLPAHQPWWLLQNMSGYPEGTSEHTLQARANLGRKIADRLRELDMTPVLPGYFGTVPAGFGDRNAGANIVPQGGWVGFTRPDWLDPNSPVFAGVADRFYETSAALLGDSGMYKMDVLHEGGRRGDVDVPSAALEIEDALQRAQPGATWALLGWQNNPPSDIAAVVNPDTTFIVDGLSDRYDGLDRESQWSNVPYAFGTIWNFGGHTTIGAELALWNTRYYEWLAEAGSAVDGIAAMPEGGLNNPAALDFFAGLAWRDAPVDTDAWFADWTFRRYGTSDAEAVAAWRIIGRTAYVLPDNGGYSEAQDGLYGAAPSLGASTAASWSPGKMAYDADAFAEALPHLLAVSDEVAATPSYRYDLMDVARQVLSNTSRTLLPQLRAAFQAEQEAKFAQLSDEWLANIELLDAVVGTQPQNLLGRWIASARAFGSSPTESDLLERDARTILTTWGEQAAVAAGLNDYANREFQGLVGGYYKGRWEQFLDAHETALATASAPATFDWHAVGAAFTNSTDTSGFLLEPTGDIEALAAEVVVRHAEARPDPVALPDPPGPGTTYLSDLPFASEEFNPTFGPVERDTEVGEAAPGDGRPMRIAGVAYAKGLGVQAPTTVTFNLGGLCTSFDAVAGIDDIMNKPDADPNVTFRVYGDDRLLYDSGAIGKGVAKTVSVDVGDVSILKLHVDPNGLDWWDRADWADARVGCGSAELPPLELSASAQTRCVGSKAFVSVAVRNDDVAPVDVQVHTPFGTKTFAAVAPGKNAFHSFAVRATSVPAGAATVTATGTGELATASFDESVDYPARSCG
ncbi:alpha-N-acetylglucosaminidase TIM-barrel domain-containing protein [Agromyces sp. NPDC058484]|uniref:alpha-N-acetylglucosaminidase TIM-barrel domain-containing protein n=1 Tax=Agromyces sp. NPDC058484 TaxID=3346524 RepID=UPI00364F98C3